MNWLFAKITKRKKLSKIKYQNSFSSREASGLHYTRVYNIKEYAARMINRQ